MPCHILSHLCSLTFLFTCVCASIIPRADPGFQYVPSKAPTPDNKFNIGTDKFTKQPNVTNAAVPAIYGPRSIDIPFTLLNKGNLKLFTEGQLNTPHGTTDEWSPGVVDHASQSACGIPDNAFWPSKVAIHPYWLKYAPAELGLSRYCMQDVCISVWNDAGVTNDDVELKVTDICSTNPEDATYCATPADIKIDRIKAHLLFSNVNKTATENQTLKTGTQWPGKVWWFFSKCWDDGLPQPVYNHSTNWFANPPLPNNLDWSKAAMTQQHLNNQKTYPKAGLPLYNNGALKAGEHRQQSLFDVTADWKEGDKVPEWCPVAGGRGSGQPTGRCGKTGSS